MALGEGISSHIDILQKPGTFREMDPKEQAIIGPWPGHNTPLAESTIEVLSHILCSHCASPEPIASPSLPR